MQYEAPTWGGIDAGGDRDLTAKFVGLIGFTLANAFDFGRMPAVKFLWTVSGLIKRDVSFT